MKYILVPTDFSPNAECALNYAAMLAKPIEAKVIIMHCKELYEEKYARYKSLINEYNQEIISGLNSKLEKIKDNIEANYQIPVSIILYEGGDVVGSILVAIRDFSVDLIVMGTYGTSGIRRKILGSKSAEVINKCAVPVITVPPDYKLRVPTNIAIAVDEKFKQQEVLKPVFDLADLFQSKLTVVSFLEESETGKINSNDTGITFMEDDFKVSFNSPACVFLNIKGEDLLNSLNQFVMEKRIDLLVMISRKRNSFQNLFDKSKTQKMSYNIIVPLLSLHQQDLS